ncbi:MAG: TonB family protein [Flavobacteriia bacterium]|nr:TonB family protein [Flavobacteriia bacterium]
MAIIYSIIVLVALISVYEYMAARRWQQVTSVSRNDLVFEHRNKEYGAYVLRKNYDKRMVLITILFIVFLTVNYGVYYFIKSIPEPPKKEEPMDLTQFTIEAAQDEKELPPPPPPEPEIPEIEKTIQFLPPIVVDHEVDNVPPIQENLGDTKTGTETHDEGTDDFVIKDEEKKEEIIEKKVEIFTHVDESAEFPGGYKEMMNFLQSNIKYPQTALDEGIQGKCYFKFAVGADGYISQVILLKGVPDCPECDKEAMRVIKTMPRWKPGKLGGKDVNSWFTMPVSYSTGN